MRLSVLGGSWRYVEALGARTAYVVETTGARILVDAGNGTEARLPASVDAVVLPSVASETVSDAVRVLRRLRGGTPVFAPAEEAPRLRHLLGELAVKGLLVHGVGDGERARVADATLAFAAAGARLAVVVEAGARVALLGDAPDDARLADFAAGADLVVLHALHLERDAPGGRLSAAAAGRLARKAGARRLALAHVPFYPHVAASVAEAAREFGGEVVELREGSYLAV